MISESLIEKFRAGEAVHICLTPKQKRELLREIRIRDAVEAKEDSREIKRRLMGRS